MRPGRLDRILYVGPPNSEAREMIFKINFNKMAVNADVDVSALAIIVRRALYSLVELSVSEETDLLIEDQTDGCSGAEIVSICQDAALNAMNENIEALNV